MNNLAYIPYFIPFVRGDWTAALYEGIGLIIFIVVGANVIDIVQNGFADSLLCWFLSLPISLFKKMKDYLSYHFNIMSPKYKDFVKKHKEIFDKQVKDYEEEHKDER